MDLVDRLNFAWPKRFKTRTAFAQAAGISKQYLGSILARTNRGAPSAETEEGLARALTMSRARLIDPDDAVFLAALERESSSPDPEPTTDRHRGLIRDYAIENTVTARGVVSGPLGGIGAKGPRAGLVEALKHQKGHRHEAVEPPVVSLAGVPEGAHLVQLAEPVEVWIEGQCKARYPAGRVLVVDPLKKPASGDDGLELVVVSRDPDFNAAPTVENPEPRVGRVRLMRAEPAARGNVLLYPLDSDEAVTVASGWRLIGVVIDERIPQRRN